ncbi:MAG: hypothetical protein HY257_00355 [Chloroflexi bacterium]|nr:hypothetical protein [Chloroflexota bacterium]
MSLVGFYIEVVRALDAINAPYMIVGAFAASTYGLARTTYDIDIIVDLQAQHFESLAAHFPLPRFYADPNQMRDSTQLGIMFNLIDTERGAKADLVPLSREPKYRQAFARRIRRTFQDENQIPFEAWCARPEDIIVGKLRAWVEGKSVKHPNDIYAMLVFIFGGYSDVALDLDYVAHNAFEVGKETIELWRDLVERAKEETQK